MKAGRAFRSWWGKFGGERSRESARETDARTVGRLLLELPRCARRVRVLWPSGTGDKVQCEWAVSAEQLEAWFREDQAMDVLPNAQSKAFLLWLRAADDRADATTNLPEPFRPLLQPRLGTLIPRLGGELICMQCGGPVDRLETEERDRGRNGAFSTWTSVHRCPAGHVIFTERHALELYFGRTGRIRKE